MKTLIFAVLVASLAIAGCRGDSKPPATNAAPQSSATTPEDSVSAAATADDEAAVASAPPLELHENYTHFLNPAFDDLDAMHRSTGSIPTSGFRTSR